MALGLVGLSSSRYLHSSSLPTRSTATNVPCSFRHELQIMKSLSEGCLGFEFRTGFQLRRRRSLALLFSPPVYDVSPPDNDFVSEGSNRRFKARTATSIS